MSDPIVYRSSWPEVIDAYERDLAKRAEWRERTNVFIREHSGGRNALTVRGFGTEHLVGFAVEGDDAENPPEGWRYKADRNMLLPDRRRKAGKAGKR